MALLLAIRVLRWAFSSSVIGPLRAPTTAGVAGAAFVLGCEAEFLPAGHPELGVVPMVDGEGVGVLVRGGFPVGPGQCADPDGL